MRAGTPSVSGAACSPHKRANGREPRALTKKAPARPRQEGGLKLQTLDNIPIGVIKVFPGIQFSLFEAIMTEKLRGIVIETFGAGNIPGDGNALLPIIRKAFQNGTVLTAARSVRRVRCRSAPTNVQRAQKSGRGQRT